MPRKRIINKKEPKNRILILCEGEKTEPTYFKGLKSDLHFRNKLSALRIVVYPSSYNTGKELIEDAEQLKKKAEKEQNTYDAVWVVLDKDGYTKHPETFTKAEATGINIAFSSISFEFWFLLHFEYTTKAFYKSDELIRYIKQKKYIPNYHKSDDNYPFLREFTLTAINNAKKLRENIQFEFDHGKKIYELNPYTDVDVLVDMLLSLSNQAIYSVAK